MKIKAQLTALPVRAAIIALAFLGVMAMPWAAVAAPDVKATQTGTFPSHPDSRAREGDTIDYTTIISNATGTSDATGVKLTNPTPANTTDTGTVTVSPLAVNDTYSTSQDAPLSVPALTGVLANDTGVPAPTVGGIVGCADVTPPFSSCATTAGGSVTLNANGSFDYTPPSGFQGLDTFSYTAVNGEAPPAATDNTATVTIVVDNAPTVTGYHPG